MILLGKQKKGSYAEIELLREATSYTSILATHYYRSVIQFFSQQGDDD